MPPPRRRQVVRARMLRPLDLLDLQVTAVGFLVEESAGGPVLVSDGEDGHLIVDLAFQHLGEEAFPESQVSPEPSGLAGHRAARPSRLVYELPAGQRLDWSLEGLLEAIPRLTLKVVPLATPGPPSYPEDESPGSGPGLVLPPWVIGPVIGPVIGRVPRRGLERAARHGAVPVHRAVVGAEQARLLRGLTRVGARELVPLPRPIDPVRPRPGRKPQPRVPAGDETALEVPYRLIVSPSAEHGAFVHDVEPVLPPTVPGNGPEDGTGPQGADAAQRAQLWHTRLTTRVVNEDGKVVGHTDGGVQRVVRAVWSRDLEAPDAGTDTDVHEPMSTNPIDRRSLVRQSAATHEGVTPVPFRVRRLYLSALGAWVDWRGSWDTSEYGVPSGWPGQVTPITTYRHVAQMGRDSYVRLTYPGFLYPFGHRCEWVKLTERKVHEATRTAYLRQRNFIVLKDTTRAWTERDTPLSRVTLDPLVTPDLDPITPSTPLEAFFPLRGEVPFAWDIAGTDQAGETISLSAPLLFVPDVAIIDRLGDGKSPQQIGQEISALYNPHRQIGARGQQVSFAASAAHGDTRLEVNHLTWDGHLDTEAFTSRPYLQRSNAVVPSMRHLAGQAPGVDLEFNAAYLADDPDAEETDQPGFGPANPSALFLTLSSPPVSLDFTSGSDRAGGFVAPNLAVRALSRSLGAVGDDGSTAGGLADGTFDPATFLQGALPKLFGLFDLVDLIEAITGEELTLDDAPSFVTDALDTVSAIATQVQRLTQAIEEARQRLAADLAAAQEMHQGAIEAIEDAQAQLETVATGLLSQLTALGDALADLLEDPTAADPAADAAADLAGSLEDLRPVVNHPRMPAAVRSALSKPLEALITALSVMEDVLDAIDTFVEGVLTPATGVSARFEWRPPIGSWPGEPPDAVFHAKDPRGFALAVEVRASAQGAPSADVSAELRDFALVLLPGEPLMAMNFSRIGFRVGSNSKPEVDVVFGGMEFLGALGFIETLRRMIPFDGFADPPYVDVSPAGVTAGFDLELPNVSVGVFSLENISLGADARVPFLGDAVTVGFNFCSKDSPFRLTVMCIGGGGWVAIRLSPMGMVSLEMGLEAAAALSVDLGVASGSVSITVGVYLRLEGEAGSLTGYFRIRGEVDVLGLISASITLELSLTYDFPTGKMVGRASIVVEVEVLFFSASVEISVERKLAGSKGDPVFREIMPPDSAGHSDAWSTYCSAFAPGA
ncbi:apolipoprotein A1/A4/E family protein [Ornithinimicrobium sp. F0845]|uniref:apolipoprotein A1/A4/E family protein n=1 Tax=Ornithinimicrobium sp. F0845 TaxID=2926412 RepID=UPI001FF1BD0F|nr:apolipoprotein A1/A4/E family protein [Ornithinimicrobium sp. F0845]MCK0113417.1 apolipoprotein A1/A4/E family protein [Ornithinimicrobium sp. F0845]